MILLSGYENDLYNRTLTKKTGWNHVALRTSTRDTTGKDYTRTEILWKNKHYSKAESSGRVPIRLTAKEKAENKINPSRKR
jgi:hypothetical protein